MLHTRQYTRNRVQSSTSKQVPLQFLPPIFCACFVCHAFWACMADYITRDKVTCNCRRRRSPQRSPGSSRRDLSDTDAVALTSPSSPSAQRKKISCGNGMVWQYTPEHKNKRHNIFCRHNFPGKGNSACMDIERQTLKVNKAQLLRKDHVLDPLVLIKVDPLV